MNVGTPDHPKIIPVWRYLTQFLNDKRVIDLPWLLRKFLVNVIIIPLRVRNSTRLYKLLWKPKGSPLMYHSLEVREKLQTRLGPDYTVFLAMRYANPDYRKVVAEIAAEGYQRLILFPLYPHQAMSTTETTVIAVEEALKKEKAAIPLKVVEQFYNHPKFIDAFASRGREHNIAEYDHIIFSFHGLPNRHLEKVHPGVHPAACSCPETMPAHGRFCYRATCYETARLLARALQLSTQQYSVGFQSRLNKNWMEPFTDKLLLSKLNEGKKRILVFCPAFVTDCLETCIEIGEEYRQMFLEAGGTALQLVESLNSGERWIEAMESMILETAVKK